MDSKSQRPSLVIRSFCISLLLLGISAILVLSLVAGLGVMEPEQLVTIPFLLAMLVGGLPLILLRTGNLSSGAIDNASGLVVLLRLARFLASNESLSFRPQVAFLFTGAEELGLAGARHFVRTHLKELGDCRHLTVINVDSPGAGPRPVAFGLKARDKLFGDLKAASLAAGIKPLIVPWVDLPSDQLAFRRSAVEVALLAAVSSRVFLIHSIKDKVDAVDPVGVDRVARWLEYYLHLRGEKFACV